MPSPSTSNPSSVLPSQSLSFPSHSSLTGLPGTALHSSPPPSALQTRFPVVLHSPAPTEHAAPLSVKSSSVSPSQSLSLSSQTSLAFGLIFASPSLQSGTSAHVVTPSPSLSKPSSTTPSPSLSILSQVS